MKFKNEANKVEWENAKDRTAKKFAEDWANEMERMLDEDAMATIKDVAFEAFESCIQKSPITGQEEYEAASLLGQHWDKGNDLYQLWIDGGIIPD